MTEQSQGQCESCDCGTFFLEAVGQFQRSQVKVHASTKLRASTPEIDQIIEKTWLKRTQQAAKTGQDLFDGRLARLVEHALPEHGLELTLGPVSYREFLGTNLTHAGLRHTHGPEVLADALGVSAAVVTRDGFVLLGRRSDRVASHAGLVHPFGGMVEMHARPVNPFDAIVKELSEEIAIEAGQISQVTCLALVRDKKIAQPELIFDVRVDAEAQAVRRAAAGASDAHEHQELISVRDQAASVVGYVQRHYAELTAITIATLLVHGLRAWGSGWFTTARGYLQKVI